MLNRLRHDVGGGVPIGMFPFGRIKGQDLDGAVLRHRGAQVHSLSVDFAGASGLIQARADGFCNFSDGCAGLILPHIAFERYFYHILVSFFNFNKQKTRPFSTKGRVV